LVFDSTSGPSPAGGLSTVTVKSRNIVCRNTGEFPTISSRLNGVTSMSAWEIVTLPKTGESALTSWPITFSRTPPSPALMFPSTLTLIPPLKSRVTRPKPSTRNGVSAAWQLHGISSPTDGK
jgi:hypothetical protein